MRTDRDSKSYKRSWGLIGGKRPDNLCSKIRLSSGLVKGGGLILGWGTIEDAT